MKYIKTYEDVNDDDWMIDIKDVVNPKLLQTLPDITDEVKKGDIIIGVWFDGDYEPFLLKVDEIDTGDDEPSLGAGFGDSVYTIDYAWGVFDVEEYKKLDPNFELKINAAKYNL